MENNQHLVHKKSRGSVLFYLILTMIIGYISLFSFNSSVSATNLEESNINSEQEIVIESVFIDGTNLTTDEIEYKLEQEAEKNMLAHSKNASTNSITVITSGIVRIGTGEVCQIYLNWKGSDPINIWRFSSMRVESNSLLFPDTYAVLGNVFKNVVGASTGSVYVGTVSVPTSQDSVRISVSGLQGYYMKSGWRSAVVKNGTAVIN